MNVVVSIIVSLGVVACAAASPAKSPPNAAKSSSAYPPISSNYRMKADAPPAARAIFGMLMNERQAQYEAAARELSEVQALLDGYEKAIIATSLKPAESPKFTNKLVWAFRSKKDKDAAIAGLIEKVAGLVAKKSRYADPNYLPELDSIQASEVKASAAITAPSDTSESDLSLMISRTRVQHDLSSGWVGKVPAMRLVAIQDRVAVVDVIATVRVEHTYYFHPVGGTADVDFGPDPWTGMQVRPVRASIVQAVVDRSVIGSAAVGEEIYTESKIFVAATVDGALYLASPNVLQWVERTP